MKKSLNFILPIFSILLLAAHFSRNNVPYLPYVFLVLPLLFLWRKEFVRIIIQVILFIGGFVWIYSIYHYVKIRIAAGQGWLRLLIILGIVSLFTFYTGFLMNKENIRLWFSGNKKN